MNGPSRATRWVRFSSASVFMALSLGLISCGGGTEPIQGETPVTTTPVQKAVIGAPAASVVISSSAVALTKVSETRISRTIYDYAFTVTVQNGSIPQIGLVASLDSVGQGTTIVVGAVAVGDLAPDASITPSATIKLRHDRAFTFDQSALTWRFTSQDGASAILGSNGGALSTSAQSVRLEVPAGALTSSTRISISPSFTNLPNEGPGFGVTNLAPDGTSFAKPVLLRMAYDCGRQAESALIQPE